MRPEARGANMILAKIGCKSHNHPFKTKSISYKWQKRSEFGAGLALGAYSCEETTHEKSGPKLELTTNAKL